MDLPFNYFPMAINDFIRFEENNTTWILKLLLPNHYYEIFVFLPLIFDFQDFF